MRVSSLEGNGTKLSPGSLHDLAKRGSWPNCSQHLCAQSPLVALSRKEQDFYKIVKHFFSAWPFLTWSDRKFHHFKGKLQLLVRLFFSQTVSFNFNFWPNFRLHAVLGKLVLLLAFFLPILNWTWYFFAENSCLAVCLVVSCVWSFVLDLLILDEQAFPLQTKQESINHLLWYVDPDKVLGTLSKEEMWQIQIVSANTAEFGQNLDLKGQYFFPLEPNFKGVWERKPKSPSLSETGISGLSSLPSQSIGECRKKQWGDGINQSWR